MVTNIELEAMVPSIKKQLFHQHIVGFVNKLELSDEKYQNNGNVRGKNYKKNFLFPMKDFFHSVQIVIQCILCQPDS